MKGKILSYDHKSNIGKIVTEDDTSIDFSIKEFIETRKIPEVGKKVIFDLFDNKAYNIIYDEINTLILSKKKKKSFSYTDDIGDLVVVINGEEYVVPTKSDIEAILKSKKNDFLDEDEAKRLLDV